MAPVHFKIFLSMAVSYGWAKVKAGLVARNAVLHELQKGMYEPNL